MDKIYYSELLPHEFRARLAAKPVAYLPLGTLEWHGEHLPLGSDAIQSEGLMVACAREIGGIVLPPIHLGPDRALLVAGEQTLYGMDYAPTTTPHRPLEGSCYWVPPGLFKSLLDALLLQLERAGFHAVFADGHGPSRWSWVADLAEREARFGLKLFGVTDDIRDAWTSQTDHAAHNETSLMLALRPDLVALDRLSADTDVWPQGVAGDDPRTATAEHGRACLATAVALVKQQFAAAGL
ncbi:MAG: creatininase family protein [Chloroflexales bacterium]|nr:creatininase family protein [Chloroflexales bacterium]